MTADLAGFLLARITETEQTAREATPGPWGVTSDDDRHVTVTADNGQPVLDAWAEYAGDWGLSADDADLAHIARHDPARVLAECEAKRRIVEIESRWRRTKDVVVDSSGPDLNGRISVTWQPDWSRPSETEIVSAQEFRGRFTEPSPPSETLRLLALPYADHEDYRDEWRP